MAWRTLIVAVAWALAVSPAWAQSVDGVDTSIGTLALRVDGDSFEPPCNFIQQLPLNGSYNGNPKARAFYASAGAALPGNGAVLHECSNFGVTGQSSPNFLAFNCNAVNADGTAPRLPQLIAFTGGPVTRVQVSAGSSHNAGQTFTLVALNAGFGVLAVNSIVLAPAMTPVSTSAAGTAFAVLVGPCIAVVDDLQFN